MKLNVLAEPLLEFGYGATHVEQRAGLAAHGPADLAMRVGAMRSKSGSLGPRRRSARSRDTSQAAPAASRGKTPS